MKKIITILVIALIALGIYYYANSNNKVPDENAQCWWGLIAESGNKVVTQEQALELLRKYIELEEPFSESSMSELDKTIRGDFARTYEGKLDSTHLSEDSIDEINEILANPSEVGGPEDVYIYKESLELDINSIMIRKDGTLYQYGLCGV